MISLVKWVYKRNASEISEAFLLYIFWNYKPQALGCGIANPDQQVHLIGLLRIVVMLIVVKALIINR
jgi:hypothetical protein